MRNITGIVIAVGLLVGLSGCQAGMMTAVGDWISTDHIEGNYNTLDVGRDYTGDATLYFYLTGDETLYYQDFDLAVADSVVQGNDHLLLFELRCDGSSCSDLDFQLECEVSRDEDELSCEGEKVWETYENFDFERD